MYPSVYNGIKYFLAIVANCLISYPIAYCVAQTIYTIYALYWDIHEDWGALLPPFSSYRVVSEWRFPLQVVSVTAHNPDSLPSCLSRSHSEQCSLALRVDRQDPLCISFVPRLFSDEAHESRSPATRFWLYRDHSAKYLEYLPNGE